MGYRRSCDEVRDRPYLTHVRDRWRLIFLAFFCLVLLRRWVEKVDKDRVLAVERAANEARRRADAEAKARERERVEALKSRLPTSLRKFARLYRRGFDPRTIRRVKTVPIV